MHLGYFELKEINTMRILPDYYFSNKQNVLEIKVNSYYKKDILKGERAFYFSKKEINFIYEILISLNFLRVKSIYDDFTRKFGVIHLPMNHEVKFSNKAKLKIDINLEKFKNNDSINNNNNNSYSKFLRKSFKSNSINISANNITLSGKKRNSLNDYKLHNNNINNESSSKFPFLKDDISFLWITGMITIIANVQNRLVENFIDGHFDSILVDVDFIKDKIYKICEIDTENRRRYLNIILFLFLLFYSYIRFYFLYVL
jgi:hypothetical protein